MTPKTLTQLIEAKNLDYVSINITEDNFPPQPMSGDYKIYHFNRYMTSEDVIDEMKKDGYRPMNIYELLEWDGWNGTDWVVALGSSCVLYDNRYVLILLEVCSECELDLSYWGGVWDGDYRFGASRNLETKTLESSDTLTLESFDKRIRRIEKLFNLENIIHPIDD